MILSHYGVGSEARTLKLILMRRLNRLCRHRGLDRYDRLEIFRAYRNGVPLPPCKPRILRSRRDTKPIRGARTTQSTRSKHHNRRADTNVRGLYFRFGYSFNTSTIPTKTETSVASADKTVVFDCTVCLERLEPIAFPKRNITGACNHNPDVCLTCLSASIATQFKNRVWDHIDCPSCGQRLEFIDVNEFADSQTFEKQVFNSKRA